MSRPADVGRRVRKALQRLECRRVRERRVTTDPVEPGPSGPPEGGSAAPSAKGGPAHSRDGRPNLNDVAITAGVSVMTASRVANGGPGVGETTRARVLAIMNQLGYRPNASARSLRTGRPTAVGIIYATPTSAGSSGLLFAVEQAAADAGFDVNLATLASLDTDSLLAAAARLAAVPVAAIVLLAPQASAAETLRSSAADVPIVALWGDDALGLPAVAVDHRRAAAAATHHLLGLGHPRVWHVSGPQSWILTTWRIQGWRDALRAARRRPPALIEGDWSPRSGYLAGRRLLERPRRLGCLPGQ